MFPLLTKYIKNPSIPFEQKNEVIQNVMTKLKPENTKYYLSLIEANSAILGTSEEITPTLKEGLQQLLNDMSDVKNTIESEVLKSSTVPLFLSQCFEIFNMYNTSLSKQCVIPIQELLEPIALPAEVVDKKIRRENLKYKLCSLLQTADPLKLQVLVKELDESQCEEGMDFTIDIDKLDLDTLDRFCQILV
ncbi:hypothetical protein EIN_173260 [Entamoeba invadens IP1]|uniref:Uncharacterized protein n=1 Tax=Entamoeba invadens IP1 TaxID=370355 RepID=A0A0A1TW19_ENTIV|nr:hypothetical protein EIN_173260 [Entamoeba invadens IP1]ELP84661.1 hypothetical protein EIN_173260 [Entamoeba invadens IP1]|eukprot:XP_004184007.1 hypothetical protein EIN_173260 [Entamoeba invadens IP1]